MAKPLQQDSEGNIINDVETAKNQKGAAAYEAENAKKQREMETKDAKFKESVKSGVEKIRGFIGMKSGGKVKKFNDGGMSLEEKYPGAKITRAGPQPPPVEGGKGSEQHIRNLEALRYMRENTNAKPELFEEPKSKGKSGGGGGGGIPKVGPKRPTEMKKGGKVSSASKRADGCAIRGKTRA